MKGNQNVYCSQIYNNDHFIQQKYILKKVCFLVKDPMLCCLGDGVALYNIADYGLNSQTLHPWVGGLDFLSWVITVPSLWVGNYKLQHQIQAATKQRQLLETIYRAITSVGGITCLGDIFLSILLSNIDLFSHNKYF